MRNEDGSLQARATIQDLRVAVASSQARAGACVGGSCVKHDSSRQTLSPLQRLVSLKPTTLEAKLESTHVDRAYLEKEMEVVRVKKPIHQCLAVV